MLTEWVAVARKSTKMIAFSTNFRDGAHGGLRFGQNHDFWQVLNIFWFSGFFYLPNSRFTCNRVLIKVKKDPEARPGPRHGSGGGWLFWFRVGVANILQTNVNHSAGVCVSISRSLIKTNGFEQKIDKIWKNHKMGHRGLKIVFAGLNRDGFFMKIMFPRSVCVKNITFDVFLKIFVFFKNCFKKWFS